LGWHLLLHWPEVHGRERGQALPLKSMRASRRTAWALGASLALHALVLAWILTRHVPVEQPPAQTAPVDVEIVERAQPATPSVKQPSRPERRISKREQAPAPKPPPEEKAPAPPSAIALGPEAPAPEPEAAPPPEGSPESKELEGAPRAGPGGDAPKREGGGDVEGGVATTGPGIFPAIPGEHGSKANTNPGLSTGRLLTNGEGEEPDPAALAEMNAENARRRVQSFAEDDLAAGRVRNGIVDGYFVDVRKSLQKNAEHPPKWTEGNNFVSDLVEAWTPGASQYARTGNPYAEGERPTGDARRENTDPISVGAREHPESVQGDVFRRQEAANRLREFADGRFGKGIVALVEIRQAPDGAFEAAALVQSSGNHLFDQHVLKTAPIAIQAAPPPPDQVNGRHEDGFRTLWSFEGRISYMKKVKAKNLTGRDALGMAGMSLLSGLTGGWVPGGAGSFDETTGEVEIIDLTSPQFVCKVKLLRVY